MLICEMESKGFVQLTKILLAPRVVTVNFGKVSCARVEPEIKYVNNVKAIRTLVMHI